MFQAGIRGSRTLAAYALAAVVGYAGYLNHVPLAWMLGPLLVAACLSIAGADLRPSENSRRLGQLTIGAAVGLNMSAPVLVELGHWFPLMLFSAFFSVFVSCVAGVILARQARLDRKTAFFASLPGGLAEMGNIGVRMGAKAEPIAIVQTLRVTLVVLTVPPVLLMLGSPDFASPPAAEVVAFHWAAGLVAGGACAAYFLKFARLNNPYMIGAVLFTAFFAASGLVSGKMPQPLFFLAQLLIGFAVGCRFRRDMLVRLPRVTLFATFSILGLIVVMACFGLALAGLTSLPYPVTMLATSPGGLAEMAATAQVLHLAIPTVVGFQVVRGVLVNGLASHYFIFFTKTGFLDLLERILGGGERN